MSVAGPLAPCHPPAWPLAGAAGGSSSGGAGDDPSFPVRRLKSTHEADVVPIRTQDLEFACEPCLLAFESEESVRAHHGNRRGVFLLMRIDPRYDQIMVETFTLAQAAAAVRAVRTTGNNA